MKSQFKITVQEGEQFPVDLRELSQLTEGKDYVLLTKKGEQKSGRGGSNRKDYRLTLESAKNIAMPDAA